jgi:signal transduction histidine kinase
VGDVNRKNEKLANLNEEKNRMMGLLAHDLRNPLGAVRLLSYELAEDAGDPELPRETGKRIDAAVDRMMEMVTRLLDVTAIDTGNFTLDIQPVHAAALLKNIAEEQASKARAKGQRILVQVEPEAPAILADSLYLKESLDNLVSNALKFMPAGPPERTLTLRLGRGWIEVEDEGPGFRPEEVEKAFGRFEHLSARPTGGEPSTGLGLSIVKSLVEAMGGSVTLVSEPGQGARFHLDFLVDPDHGAKPELAP